MTYNETKRIISFRKGGNVLELKNVFLQKFSDVLPPNVSPEQVKFQRYDKRFQDFVDLDDGYELSKDLKVRAHLMENKQVQTFCAVSDSYNLKYFGITTNYKTN